jgi:hypothetical protein
MLTSPPAAKKAPRGPIVSERWSAIATPEVTPTT